VTIKSIPLFDNPYMMPCFIGALANAISFGLTLFLVPETKKKDGTKKEKSKVSLNISSMNYEI
jgi:hypothetical protein